MQQKQASDAVSVYYEIIEPNFKEKKASIEKNGKYLSIEGIVRAKRKPYISVVLSREEIDLLITQLEYPYVMKYALSRNYWATVT